MVGPSPVFTSILVLLSLFKTPKPPKKNITSTPTPRVKIYTTTTLTVPFNLLTSIVETPTFHRRVKLFSKTGFHLVMLPNGLLKGSLSSSIINKYGIFELQSYGPSVIRIKSVARQRFIAISQNGKVHSTEKANVCTILRETRRQNSFHSFSSYIHHGTGQHKNWYLAIKQNGHLKNASKVLRHHKSYQFQVLEEVTKSQSTDAPWLPDQTQSKG